MNSSADRVGAVLCHVFSLCGPGQGIGSPCSLLYPLDPFGGSDSHTKAENMRIRGHDKLTISEVVGKVPIHLNNLKFWVGEGEPVTLGSV